MYKNEKYNLDESFREAFKIYLYDKDGKRLGIYIAPSQEEFEADKLKYCSEYVEGENYISYVEILNAVVDNGTVREAMIRELIEAGEITLNDGQYLDGEEVKTLAKPNEWSVWNKTAYIWEENKELKKEYLEKKRYELQQNYLDLKHKKEKLEEEKAEFEELGFDTTLTEENIKVTDEEMKKIITEIKAIAKELKKI